VLYYSAVETMKAVVPISIKEAPARQAGNRSSAQAVQAPQPVFSAPIFIQRKCACGGECPSCQKEELEESHPIQTKLKVNTPGDAFEQEADRIADQVVGMSAPPHGAMTPLPVTPVATSLAQRKAIESASSPVFYAAHKSRGRAPPMLSNNLDHLQGSNCLLLLQRKCACGGGMPCSQCEDEPETPAQRKAAPGPGKSVAGPETLPQTLGFGRPLDDSIRVYMESRFGSDFSQVRIHDSSKAASAAKSVNALAYTVGRDIVFGEGRYAPATDTGKKLLAHELTHVLQQGGVAAELTIQRKESNDLNAGDKTEGGSSSELDDFLECPTPPTRLGSKPPPNGPCSQPSFVPSATELVRLHFCKDSDIVTPNHELNELDKMIEEQPRSTRFVAHGYASSEGDPQYNLRLSCHRAQAVGRELADRLRASLEKLGKQRNEIDAEIARRIEVGARGPTAEFFGGKNANRVVVIYGQIPGQNLGFEPACEIAPRRLGDIEPEVPCDTPTGDLASQPESDQIRRFEFCVSSDVLRTETAREIQGFAFRHAATSTFVIHGFASEEDKRDHKSNERLSCHRALRIARELTNAGVAPTQIREVAGLGPTRRFDEKRLEPNRVALVLAEKGEIPKIKEPAADVHGKDDESIRNAALAKLKAGEYRLEADTYISFWTCGRTPSVREAVRRMLILLPQGEKAKEAPTTVETAIANGTEESLGPNIVRLSANALRADNPVECTMARIVDMAFHHAVKGEKGLKSGKKKDEKETDDFAGDDATLRHQAGLHLADLAGLGPCLGRTAEFKPPKASNQKPAGIEPPRADDPLATHAVPECARPTQPTRLLGPQPGEKDRKKPQFQVIQPLDDQFRALEGKLEQVQIKGPINDPAVARSIETTTTNGDVMSASAALLLTGAKSTFADYEFGLIQTMTSDLTTAEYTAGEQVLHQIATPIRAAQARGEPASPEPWMSSPAFRRADPDGIVMVKGSFRLNTDFAPFSSLFHAAAGAAGVLDVWHRRTKFAVWLTAHRIGAPLDRFGVEFLDGIEYEVSEDFDVDVRRVRPISLDPERSHEFTNPGDDERLIGDGTFATRQTSAKMRDPRDARLLNPAAAEIDLNRQRHQSTFHPAPAEGLSAGELKEVIREIVDGIQVFGTDEDMRNDTNASTVPRLGFDFSPLEIAVQVSRFSGRVIGVDVTAPRLGERVLFHLSHAIVGRLEKSDFLKQGKTVALRPDEMKKFPDEVRRPGVAAIPIHLDPRAEEPKLEDPKLAGVDIRKDMAEMLNCTLDTIGALDSREFGAVYWLDRDKKLHREPTKDFKMGERGNECNFETKLPCDLQPHGMLMGTVHTHPGCDPEPPQQEVENPSQPDVNIAKTQTCGLEHFVVSRFGVVEYLASGKIFPRNDIKNELRALLKTQKCRQVKSPDDLEKKPAALGE